jgi:transcriptional antiterminator/mannitol/fructose-specific phosphotransferase system IIA component (Ntr-type)
MNERASMIFSTILSSNQALQVSCFASLQKVSERTIRNDMGLINDMLSSKGLPLLEISHSGQVTFQADRDKVMEIIGDADPYRYRLSKSARRTIVSLQMLFADPYVTIAELADSVSVSRATLLNDLPDVKAFFNERQLHVDSHSNKGLRVIGAEREKRRAAMELLSSTVRLFDADNAYSPYQSIVLSILDRDGSRKICEQILKTAERRQERYLSDLSFYKASNYLILALRRMRAGQFLPADTADKGENFQFSREILTYLANQFDLDNLELADGEIRFLHEVLKNLRYIRHKRAKYQDIIKLQTITTNFIRKVSEELGTDLSDDYTFYNNLTDHLQSTVLNAGNHEQDETLRDLLRTGYGDVQDGAVRHVRDIERFIKRRLNENEISYIVLHVCAAVERKRNRKLPARILVACAGGLGTSQLLTERLRRQFSFDIAAVTSVHNLDQYVDSGIDFIVATVPLRKISHPHVVVTPFLNDADYLKILKQLEIHQKEHVQKELPASHAMELMNGISKALEARIGDVQTREAIYDCIYREVRRFFGEAEQDLPRLHELLPPEHILLDVSCGSYQEAVRLSADILLKNGFIEQAYVDAMLRNLEENGPYVVISPGFAFPHAGLDSGAIRTGMSLIRLKEPVPFGHEEYDPVDLVCCLSAVDSENHSMAFFNLVNMLQTKDFKQKLRLACEPEQAHEIIRSYEITINQR